MMVRLPFVYRATLLAIVGVTVAWFAVIFRAVYPAQTVTIKEPIEVFGPTTIRAGDPIEFIVTYCATRAEFGWVSGKYGSNGVVTPLGLVWPASLPKGCHVVHLRLGTHLWMLPGSYKFYMTRHYQPTVLGDFEVDIESQPFTIVARPTVPE